MKGIGGESEREGGKGRCGKMKGEGRKEGKTTNLTFLILLF